MGPDCHLCHCILLQQTEYGEREVAGYILKNIPVQVYFKQLTLLVTSEGPLFKHFSWSRQQQGEGKKIIN